MATFFVLMFSGTRISEVVKRIVPFGFSEEFELDEEDDELDDVDEDELLLLLLRELDDTLPVISSRRR